MRTHAPIQIYLNTAKNIMRVYPGGLRVNSSNYNPTHAWSLGKCPGLLSHRLCLYAHSLVTSVWGDLAHTCFNSHFRSREHRLQTTAASTT